MPQSLLAPYCWSKGRLQNIYHPLKGQFWHLPNVYRVFLGQFAAACSVEMRAIIRLCSQARICLRATQQATELLPCVFDIVPANLMLS